MSKEVEKLGFSDFLRIKRLEKGYGLREFARLIKMQPSNYCSIESDTLTAPSEDKLKRIVDILELSPSDKVHFFDLAAKSTDDIPADIKDLIKKNRLIPAMLRTVENEKIGAKQLNGIIKDIKSGKFRKTKT